ncbi:MAG: hypothetical protein JWM25_803 [Thermoleophilia bacterium]|nr:hypothetical protein [Thermoleophilia bacterium]MCZ4496220.1 hypothetical protein [Thermoleophilia bacterium]
MVQAQWFLCQLALFRNDRMDRSASRIGTKEITDQEITRLQVARDLSEASNTDFMLRDTALAALFAVFARAMRLQRHRDLVHERLALAASAYQATLATRQDRVSRNLQHLFAVSAATGVATIVTTRWDAGDLAFQVAVLLIALFLIAYGIVVGTTIPTRIARRLRRRKSG